MTSTVESHTDLGGFWQSGTVKATGGGMPGTMEGSFRMTYEPGTKQYVLFWMDSMGAFSKAVSSAWEGDTMVFTGEGTMGGLTTPVRDSFTKGADGTLQHTWEIQADGKWMPMGKETCRKAG